MLEKNYVNNLIQNTLYIFSLSIETVRIQKEKFLCGIIYISYGKLFPFCKILLNL